MGFLKDNRCPVMLLQDGGNHTLCLTIHQQVYTSLSPFKGVINIFSIIIALYERNPHWSANCLQIAIHLITCYPSLLPCENCQSWVSLFLTSHETWWQPRASLSFVECRTIVHKNLLERGSGFDCTNVTSQSIDKRWLADSWFASCHRQRWDTL